MEMIQIVICPGFEHYHKKMKPKKKLNKKKTYAHKVLRFSIREITTNNVQHDLQRQSLTNISGKEEEKKKDK